MSGTVILSHGFNSGPGATKVDALAKLARGSGWQAVCPDFRADDAPGAAGAVAPRLARLQDVLHGVAGPVVLVGSSLGAFVAALAAADIACAGLFLLALPVAIPGCPLRPKPPRGVRAVLVHGYRDELCPYAAAVEFAIAGGASMLLLDDTHRLAARLDVIGEQFSLFLRALTG